MLIGEPGTAKSWLSEHLSAAICGTSTYLIQGTAGTTEDQIRYSWNYALLVSEGPSPASLVSTPTINAMREGKILRFEELTRCPQEIQDSMISISCNPAQSEELMSIQLAENRRGLIAIEPKKDIKKRIGRSPNYSDAIMMMCATFEDIEPIIEAENDWDRYSLTSGRERNRRFMAC